jgi:hypothetical protein
MSCSSPGALEELALDRLFFVPPRTTVCRALPQPALTGPVGFGWLAG